MTRNLSSRERRCKTIYGPDYETRKSLALFVKFSQFSHCFDYSCVHVDRRFSLVLSVYYRQRRNHIKPLLLPLHRRRLRVPKYHKNQNYNNNNYNNIFELLSSFSVLHFAFPAEIFFFFYIVFFFFFQFLILFIEFAHICLPDYKHIKIFSTTKQARKLIEKEKDLISNPIFSGRVVGLFLS